MDAVFNMFGVTFNTNLKGKPKKIQNRVSLFTAKAFSMLMAIGDFSRKQSYILVNEVLRGRLDVKDPKAVIEMADSIDRITSLGVTIKDIAILRSLDLSFEDIEKIGKEKKSLNWVLEDMGIDEPDVETIYGLTSHSLTDEYVSYKEALEVRGV